MTPAAAHVRVVVVTTEGSHYLAETLAGVRRQSHPYDSVDVVVASSHNPPPVTPIPLPKGLAADVRPVTAATFGEAVTAALLARPAGHDEWLWLLHDDSAPEEGALALLLAAGRKRRRAGVVGASQVGWDDPSRLVNVGVTVSRHSGRRISAVEQDDVDQGQHEGTEDVLAVGLAGSLVRRALWDRLRGTDSAYGPFGDSVDFCRRAWRAGSDVVVAPLARVRHAQATMYGRSGPGDQGGDPRDTYARRRASEWYHAMAWGPKWAVAPRMAWAAASAVGRAVLRLVTSDPRMVSAELRTPLVLAARLRHLGVSRARIAAAGPAGDPPVEAPLLAGPLQVIAHVRSRELGAYEQWRAFNTPTEVQQIELKALAVRRRWTLAFLAASLAGVAVALYGTWLAPLVRGEMLTGTALGVTDVSRLELWQRTWSGWSDAGLGSPAVDGTWAGLMLPFSAVPGGLALGIGMLLACGPLIAGIAAWLAAGAVTRSLTARVLASVVWGVWPAFLQSIADGRVGSVIAHIALPLFALALVRSVGAQARDRLGDGMEFPSTRSGTPVAAAGASLAMVVVTVAAPVLLLPLVLVTLAATIAATGRRRYAFAIPVAALVVHGPALWHAAHSADWLALLVREPGPALPSSVASPAQLLWGVPQAPPAWPDATATGNLLLTYLCGTALVVAATVALIRGRGLVATRVGCAVAGIGLALAVVSQRVVAAPAGLDGSPAANGWPGPGLSLMALGLLTACAGAAGRAASTKGAVARARGAAAALAAVVVAIQVVATVWPGRDFGGDVHPVPTTVLPLVASVALDAPPGTRILTLRSADGVVFFSVQTADGTTALLGRPFVTAADGGQDVAVLAEAVAAIAGAGETGTSLLRDWGVGVVVVSADSPQIEGAVLRVGVLTLAGSSGVGSTWTVGASGEPPVARAWIQSGVGADAVAVAALASSPTGLSVDVSAGEPGRVVIVAAPASRHWRATLDGHRLAQVPADGRVAFALGTDAGHLEVSYVDTAYRWWWWAAVIALVWTLVSAIPLHDRRFVRERS